MGTPLAGPMGKEWFGWPLPAQGLRDRADLIRVAAAFAAAQLPWAMLRSHVRFDPAGYVRQPIYRDDTWELLLLCWLPGQATAVHGHDGSSGLVRLLAGTLEECGYEALDAPRPAHRRTLHGQGLLVELPETIHRVANAGSTPALSLHLYSPPLPAR